MTDKSPGCERCKDTGYVGDTRIFCTCSTGTTLCFYTAGAAKKVTIEELREKREGKRK